MRFHPIVLILVLCLCGVAPTIAAQETNVPKEVTFNRDVAPIFYKNCVVCHRPNDMAPMSLMTYKDAANVGAADSRGSGEPQDAAVACRSQGGRFHQRPAADRRGDRHHRCLGENRGQRRRPQGLADRPGISRRAGTSSRTWCSPSPSFW